MDFWDDDSSSRPKLLVQSRSSSTPSQQQQQQQSHKISSFKSPLTILTLTISSIFLLLSFLFIQTEPLKSLLIWLSLSLLLGPLAPTSLTAGSVLVGQGPLVTFPEPTDPEEVEPEAIRRRKPKSRKKDDAVEVGTIVPGFDSDRISQVSEGRKKNDGCGVEFEEEEREWTEGDVKLLKKQLLKHPVGKLRRWEVIAEAFNGRHRVESVIQKSKRLGAGKSGEKEDEEDDSYARFLKDRKPLLDKSAESSEIDSGVGGFTWNAGDDIALLNAVKTFPKDVSMRWEKVAAAVPGKTKAACVKRFSELKKDFRNSKKAVADE